MSWILSVGIILAGISGILKPEVPLDQMNKTRIKNGKPPFNEAERPRHLRKTRLCSLFVLVCGIMILFCDIMLAGL